MSAELHETSPLDPDVVQCPFPYYESLRHEAPVHWVPEEEFFLVTRHEDALAVVKRPDLFSSRSGPGLRRKPTPEIAAIMAEGYSIPNTLLTNDPPAHKRYRTLVNMVFTPRQVKAMEPSMVSLANELVDAFQADGKVELVSQFAVGLPLTVIADALGVPRDMLATFKRWSDDSVAPQSGNLSPERRAECARSIVEFQHYFAERLEERRQDPRDDLLTHLIDARIDGSDRLNTEEMLAIIWVVLVAGNETTTNLISATVKFLLDHPEQIEAVTADRSLVANAVEESLRYSSPAFANRRVATEDTEIGGVPIPKGSHLYVIFGSANRDADIFDDPDRFDVCRSNAKAHIAFGHGIHFCLGAALARKEATIALNTLLDRLPNLRFAPGNEFRYFPDMILRGLEELHLEFDPA
jgi:cytochrome P450